jgi:adenosylmethionine-8-amino-7-oxononanoate aminotransferase
MAATGDGVWLIDQQGRRYLDACGGAAVSGLGHAAPAITQAIREQLDRLAFAHTSFFSSSPAEALAERLVAQAPVFASRPGARLDRVFVVSSGSEAIEAAIKLARQAALERGQHQRTQIIARRQSYHGNTLGALAVSGNAARRKLFGEFLFPVRHVSPCYAYRGLRPGETAQAYSERLIKELEAAILETGPDRVLAFFAEPVVGATLGAVAATQGYFQGVRQLCDRYGIFLILDEVMCGMGRTGTLFAYEQEHIQPDMVTIAKGLGAGYQPIAALMVSEEIHDTIAKGSGAFEHGQTYVGHPVACAAAVAVLDVMQREQLIAPVAAKGALLMDLLKRALSNSSAVGDLRGRGLFVGIELVADQENKTPFDPQLRVHAQIKQKAMALGLLCYPMGGTIDGSLGDHVVLAPPLTTSDAELELIAERLAAAIHSVTESLGVRTL